MYNITITVTLFACFIFFKNLFNYFFEALNIRPVV